MGKPTLTREEIALLTEGLGIDPLSITTDSLSDEDRLAILQGRILKPDETRDEATDSPLRPGVLRCWQETGDVLTEQVAACFGVDASIQVDRFDRSTVAQFLLRRSSAACLFRWEMPDCQTQWWLSMDSSLVFPMLEHLLGAPLAPTDDAQRVMTDVERGLTPRILKPWQTAIANVWPEFDLQAQPILGCDGDSSTSRRQIACCDFVVHLGPVQGRIALAVPWQYMNSTRMAELPADASEEAIVNLSVVLARAKISQEELNGLAVGDVISTDQKHDQPLQVEIDGQVRFLARPGTQNGKKAIRID